MNKLTIPCLVIAGLLVAESLASITPPGSITTVYVTVRPDIKCTLSVYQYQSGRLKRLYSVAHYPGRENYFRFAKPGRGQRPERYLIEGKAKGYTAVPVSITISSSSYSIMDVTIHFKRKSTF